MAGRRTPLWLDAGHVPRTRMPGTPLGGWSQAGPLGLSHSTGAPQQGPIVLAGLFSSDDVLANYPPDRVAGWYGRLADAAQAQGGVLAPQTLRFWLSNHDPTAKLVIAPHPHLVNSELVVDALPFHRSVYLTEKKAAFGKTEKWAGVIPRLQGLPGFTRWDGKGSLDMTYQALVQYSTLQSARFGLDRMSVGEADVFTSFHNFQLRTEVTVTIATDKSGTTTLTFQKFEAKAVDRYDWDPAKHLTVVNPDFNRADTWAIRPDLQKITVYHSNAKRVEAANLAAPYDLATSAWAVTDPKVTAPANIDPGKKL